MAAEVEPGPADWSPPVGPPLDGDRLLLSRPSRQSPIALIFIAARFVRQLGISAVVAAVVIVTRNGLALGVLLAAMVAATALVVFSALSWWRFTFVIAADELVVTKGIVSVERLVIPLDRVQSVAIDQRLTHRIFGLVSASVDTAGSAGVEFEIDAIDSARAEALRRVAADARSHARAADGSDGGAGPAVAATRPDEVLLRRSPTDLVRIGLTKTPWAGLLALAPLIAVAGELDQFLGLGSRLEQLADGTGDMQTGSTVVAVIVGLVVAATAIGILLQLAREVLTNWNLTLHLTQSGLRRNAGLLNTTSRSSTMRRIQSITTDDSPVQRWLGITHLRLRTFGDNDISLPGSNADEVATLRRLVAGQTGPPDLDRSISPWYVFKATRNATVVALFVGVAAWFRFGWWSAFVLLGPLAQWVVARREWKLWRWSLDDHRIAESRQFLARHTSEVPLQKAQVVTVSQSFFERRRGLASVDVRTAAGSLTVPLIPYDEAAATRDVVLRSVETDRRRFL